jgi:hypothetical protein
MACTHTAAMAVLAKMDGAFGTERRVAAFGSTAARLMRAYAASRGTSAVAQRRAAICPRRARPCE